MVLPIRRHEAHFDRPRAHIVQNGNRLGRIARLNREDLAARRSFRPFELTANRAADIEVHLLALTRPD